MARAVLDTLPGPRPSPGLSQSRANMGRQGPGIEFGLVAAGPWLSLASVSGFRMALTCLSALSRLPTLPGSVSRLAPPALTALRCHQLKGTRSGPGDEDRQPDPARQGGRLAGESGSIRAWACAGLADQRAHYCLHTEMAHISGLAAPRPSGLLAVERPLAVDRPTNSPVQNAPWYDALSAASYTSPTSCLAVGVYPDARGN